MKKIATALLVLLFGLAAQGSLLACSVCFGDSNSSLVHGAKAAVFFLVGVVFTVLFSFVGVAIFWFRRARLLDVQATLQHDSQDL